MNSFRQHIPNFVDVDHPGPIPFETTEQLLALEVVQQYSKGPDFSYFAMSGPHLMQIREDGFYWWVVGYIDQPELVDLPKWEGGKYRAVLPDGTKAILTNEVIASCGDELTLRDGSTARWMRLP